MAKLVCSMTDCKYCGRKSSKYQQACGKPLYNCKKIVVQIYEPLDWDDVYKDVYNKKQAICMDYKPVESEI